MRLLFLISQVRITPALARPIGPVQSERPTGRIARWERLFKSFVYLFLGRMLGGMIRFKQFFPYHNSS